MIPSDPAAPCWMTVQAGTVPPAVGIVGSVLLDRRATMMSMSPGWWAGKLVMLDAACQVLLTTEITVYLPDCQRPGDGEGVGRPLGLRGVGGREPHVPGRRGI